MREEKKMIVGRTLKAKEAPVRDTWPGIY